MVHLCRSMRLHYYNSPSCNNKKVYFCAVESVSVVFISGPSLSPPVTDQNREIRLSPPFFYFRFFSPPGKVMVVEIRTHAYSIVGSLHRRKGQQTIYTYFPVHPVQSAKPTTSMYPLLRKCHPRGPHTALYGNRPRFDQIGGEGGNTPICEALFQTQDLVVCSPVSCKCRCGR